MVGNFKCVVVGDGAVGKTSMLVSHKDGHFPLEYVPTVFDTYAKLMTIGSKKFYLHLIDTAGQEDYDRLRPLSYGAVHVLIVCFSVVHPPSFMNVEEKWVPEIEHYCPGVPFLLVGTMIDLREDKDTLGDLDKNGRVPVTSEMGLELAKKLKAVKYVECSALTQEGLDDVFKEVLFAAMEMKSSKTPEGRANECVIN